MSWRGVGFGGSCLELDNELTHRSGNRVAALQSCWIEEGGVGAALVLEVEWSWFEAKERERRERKKKKRLVDLMVMVMVKVFCDDE